MNLVKILLVDDDEDDFILTRDILRESANSQNYQLTWCNDFSEAINAMLKGFYDLYLVDYRLGKDSGIALLNEAIKSNCTEPIIILTGKGDFKIDQEAMHLGAADYLVKDKLNAQTLERAIRYAVSGNKTLKSLKASENKFRIIFERSKDPMLITTPQGQIVDANPSAVDFFESTLAELLKQNAASLYKHKVDRESYTAIMNAEGAIRDLELEILTLKQNTRFCSISSFLQVSQHANEQFYYSIIHDLTFRLNQEREAALTEKLTSTARIASVLSYEIQDPLSNINLAIDELRDTLANEDSLILTDIIRANCEKINKLTTQLIESTEHSSLTLTDVDLNVLIDELLTDAKHELDLTVAYSQSETPTIIKAEADDLKRALLNILQNASESIDQEDKQVSLAIEKRATHVAIDIEDNGNGIRSEDLDKIFEPFFTTKMKSIGLGLTRAQRIINAHQGKLYASSTIGSGTKVTIQLPLS
jgi:PAS domain S-box-containing protein